MSHFSVAVFTDGKKTVEELLAPYEENNEGGCLAQYLEFISATKENQDEYETGKAERICLKDGSCMEPWDTDELKKMFSFTTFNDGKDHSFFYKGKNEYLIRNSGDAILGNVQIVFHLGEEGARLQMVPYKEIYPSLQDYARDYLEAPWDEEMQDYGYWVNPNAKCDWWRIGGRWDKFLKNIKGERCAEAKVADIDFEVDRHSYHDNLRWWEVVVEESPMREDENPLDFFNTRKKEFLLKQYKNKETYARVRSSVITYAVIMPDGTWYQKGDMGWFGSGSETAEESYDWDVSFKETFIDKADPNWTLTIVDCHI